jgi:hypothetical protein
MGRGRALVDNDISYNSCSDITLLMSPERNQSARQDPAAHASMPTPIVAILDHKILVVVVVDIGVLFLHPSSAVLPNNLIYISNTFA